MHLSISKFFRYLFTIFLSGVLWSCGGNATFEDLRHLSGYWEIESVTFPNGETKKYPVNTTVDYYSWNGEHGFLKKVQPEFTGRFLANDDAVKLAINPRKDMLILIFTGKNDTWEEELLLLNSENMETRHQNGLTYRYKKFAPLITYE